MGAWGTGPFENDCALDWVLDFEDAGVPLIKSTFQNVAAAHADGYIEVDEGAAAIAAGEVIAAAHGHPMAAADEDSVFLRVLTARSSEVAADASLPGAALKALTLATEDPEKSENVELWADADPSDNAAFLAGVADLCARLERLQ